MTLIDKSDLVAEIEKLKYIIMPYPTIAEKVAYRDGIEDTIKIVIKYLEVKEVDLDKELNKYFITNNLIAADIQFEPVTQMKKCAQYFFELGMQVSNKAQKGE